jgi:hypothetical protein
MAAQPSFKPGEILTSRDDDSGRYQVSKVLYADEDVVVTRLYVNRSTSSRPRCRMGFGST